MSCSLRAIQSLKEPAERDAFMADALELPRSQVHALQHTSEMLEASGHSHAHAHGQEQARGPAAEDSTSTFLIAHTAQTRRPENADCDSMSMSVASEDGDEEEKSQGLHGCGSSIEGFSRAGSCRHGGNRHASFSGAVGSARAWRHARQTAGRPRLPVHTSEQQEQQQHGLQQQWRQQQWQQCRLREQVNTANDEQPPVGELDDGDQEQPRLAELQALDDDSWFDCLSDSYAAPQRVKHRPRRLGHLSRYKRQSPDVVPT